MSELENKIHKSISENLKEELFFVVTQCHECEFLVSVFKGQSENIRKSIIRSNLTISEIIKDELAVMYVIVTGNKLATRPMDSKNEGNERRYN